MYNEVLELIKQEAEELQKKILLDPTYLFKKDKKFKKNKLCLDLANRINRRLQEPWITQEELQSLYNKPVWKEKTSCKNIYYTNGDVRIYSSVNHERFYIDNEYNMYILLKLCHNGDITKYYNPFIEVKLNLLGPFTMLRLTTGGEINFDLKAFLNRQSDDKDRIKICGSGEKIEDEVEFERLKTKLGK